MAEDSDHKHTLVGVFNRVFVSHPERVVGPIFIFLALSHVTSDPIRIQVMSPKGETVFGGVLTPVIEESPSDVMLLNAGLGLTFTAPIEGNYTIQVVFNDLVIGAAPLIVTFAPNGETPNDKLNLNHSAGWRIVSRRHHGYWSDSTPNTALLEDRISTAGFHRLRVLDRHRDSGCGGWALWSVI